MAKIISVWGSPNSGKTTFSLMLAKTIYDMYTSKVICILSSNVSPDIPVVFPNASKDDLHSLGDLLSKADITTKALEQHLIVSNDKINLGYMGYTYGDNIYSYAEYTSDKVSDLISTASKIADFIIIDCGSVLKNNVFGMTAIKMSDYIFRICSPDYKSVSFFASQLSLYSELEYRTEDNIRILNINENDVFVPVQELKQNYDNVKYILPYDLSIKKSFYNGSLIKTSLSKNYLKVMKEIIEKVV